MRASQGRWWAAVMLVLAMVGRASGQTGPTDAPPAPGLTNVFNAAPAGTFTGTTNNISVAVHGLSSSPAEWANSFLDDVGDQTVVAGTNWDRWALDWSQDAVATGFLGAPGNINLINAQIQGQYLAKTLIDEGYTKVHLYGHSLGGRVIETAATILAQAADDPTVQTTFLDPYTPNIWNMVYGRTSTYSDEVVNNNDYPNTNDYLPNAFSIDVTAAGPVTDITTWGAGHSWPYQWYQSTIQTYPNTTVPGATYSGLGFAMSLEIGGTGKIPARGTVDYLKASGQSVAFVTSTPATMLLNQKIFNPGAVGAVLAKSGNNVTVDNNKITIDTTKNGFEWVNLALNLTTPINYIDFNFNFSTDDDGTLAMRMDNTLMWAGLDQYALTNQAEDTGLITFGTPLDPGQQHILSFRLDAGAQADSDVVLSNINTGLIPEPSSLVMLVAAAGLLGIGRRGRRSTRE